MQSETWPDPADWIARLAGKLVELDTQYMAISQIRRMRADPDETGNAELINGDPQANATLTAAAALSTVVIALKELPTFQGNVGLTALSDLGMSLADLDVGLRPVMLQPRRDILAPRDGAGRRVVKAHVVLCVELLELAGMTNAAARKEIARIFAAHGFRGRKGGRQGSPLSPQTVYEWSTALSRHGDREGRAIVDRGIADWRAKRPWPPLAHDVLQVAASFASDPALQIKAA